MKNVLLFGESPNDTSCIASLMQPRYRQEASFGDLVRDIYKNQIKNEFKGGVLLTEVKSKKSKLRTLIQINYRIKRPELVIFVIDLDAPESNREEKLIRQTVFNRYNSQVDNKGVLLLNIYELEAILLADIHLINSEFNLELPPHENVMSQEDPKGHLEKVTKYKYNDSQNPKLFPKLNFQTVLENCSYFQKFITEFEQKLISA